MNYYDKYIKYKSKYLHLKKNDINQNGGKNNKYFFIHNTTTFDNLLTILKTNTLKISSQVDKERRTKTSGNVNYIYSTMYFKDLNNLTHLPDFSLILSDKLLQEYDIRINKGWTGNELISISHTDDKLIKNKKFNILKKFLKNPKDFPKTLIEPSGLLMHEVLFDRNIEIDKYLLGIVCNKCNNEQLSELKKFNYKIYTTNIIPEI